MATNNSYYGYTSGVQQSQVYGTQLQTPQAAPSAYTAQPTAPYVAQSSTSAASAYGGQPAAQARVQTPQTQPGYAATGATSYPQAALSGSTYGYTARVQETSPGYQTTGYSSQTATSYYDRDTSASSASVYDAAKANSYYGTQHSAPSQQAYGYGSSTPTASKNLYSNQSHYSPASVPNPVAQGSSAAAQKPHTPASQSNISGNVSYPYSTGKQNYNQNAGSYSSSSSNWSNSGNMNSYHGQAYDAAVYNAASSYFQQQQQPRPKWGKSQNMGNKQAQQRQKNPPKQQQVHYCDVCKISCAGPQTYKEHLEGQKHKKKEVAAKQLESVGADGYKCSLCDVVCTGTDAFNAHLKGAKHLKTVKLHTKLGKPIPDIPSAEVQDKEKKKDETKETAPKNQRNQGRRNRKPSQPKITFIGGSSLNTAQIQETILTSPVADGTTTPASTTTSTTTTTPQDEEKKEGTDAAAKEAKFVGEEYIEEVKGENGKVTAFECKLCECKFNDQLAREAHLGGRRHKLSYKRKVQPDYIVDSKPSAQKGRQQQHKPLMDDKARRKWEQDMYWRKQEANWRQEEVGRSRWGEEEYWRRLEEEERMWEEQEHHGDMMEWERRHRMAPPRADLMAPDMFNAPRPRQDSQDDRVLMSKHKQIYPNEQELTAVQNIVSAVEKSLKLVSDNIAEEDAPTKTEDAEKMEVNESVEVKPEAKPEVKVEVKVEVKTEVKTEEKTEEKKGEVASEEPKKTTLQAKADTTPPRALKGVMRVGVLAKGLLLHEKLDVQLVVLCQERPTPQLLNRVYSKLPEQLTKVAEEKYDVSLGNPTIVVSTIKEPSIKVVITLTSPVMRDSDVKAGEEQNDVLDREKCLEALASLRHAKWFQAKANGVPSCVVIIRILRDMKTRVAAFGALSCWSMELLVEKCLSSSEQPLAPGEAFRRVMESISSGAILPGGPGLHDPCEKELTDAAIDMTAQEREDLTACAQQFLRLQAFRQLHKVLGVDPLPPAKYKSRYGRGGRFKRRREDSGQGDGNAKKEKKDGDAATTTPTKTDEGTAEPKPVEPAKAEPAKS